MAGWVAGWLAGWSLMNIIPTLRPILRSLWDRIGLSSGPSVAIYDWMEIISTGASKQAKRNKHQQEQHWEKHHTGQMTKEWKQLILAFYINFILLICLLFSNPLLHVKCLCFIIGLFNLFSSIWSL